MVVATGGDVVTADCKGGLVVWRRDEHGVFGMTQAWALGLKDAHRVSENRDVSTAASTAHTWQEHGTFSLV